MTEPHFKAALRAEAAERRARAARLNPLAGHTLAALFPRALAGEGAVVAGYWPFRDEIDPRPLLRRLATLGHRLALPVTPPKGTDAPLVFRSWAFDAPLQPGHFRVPEPGPDREQVEPDVVLTPLLAFDSRGGRLGYGAGHFDRTLERLRALKPVIAVGLAYAAQAVDHLPVEPHDQPLDGVLTERGYAARKD